MKVPESNEWLDNLPEDIRDHDEIKGMESVEALAQRVIDMGEKHTDFRDRLGRAVEIPRSDATESDWQAFDERVGKAGYAKADEVPEKPDGYKFNGDLDGLPFEGEKRDSFLEGRQKYYHDMGLGKRTAGKLIKAEIEDLKTGTRGLDEAETAGASQLREKLGDKFQSSMALAAKAAQAMGIADILDEPRITLNGKVEKLGNNVELMMSLSNMGSRMGEDKSTAGSGAGEATPSGPEQLMELKATRAEKMAEFSKLRKTDPGDPRLVAVRRELMILSGKVAAAKSGVAFQMPEGGTQAIADVIAKRRGIM